MNDKNEMPETEIVPEIEALMFSQQFISGADKIAEKLNEEHITKIIESSAKDNERSFISAMFGKIAGLVIFFLSLIFAFILLLIFKDSEHFQTILTAIFSFLGGLGVGKFIIPNSRKKD